MFILYQNQYIELVSDCRRLNFVETVANLGRGWYGTSIWQ